MMYAHGKGVKQNYTEAVKWIRKAAEQGYEPAIDMLHALKNSEHKIKTPTIPLIDEIKNTGMRRLGGKRETSMLCPKGLNRMPTLCMNAAAPLAHLDGDDTSPSKIKKNKILPIIEPHH